MRALAISLAACTAILDSSADTVRRDPTQPPPGYGAQQHASRDPVEAFRPTHLVTVDGQRYLVWRGKRLGVGDTVDGARIERLDESEVWLRSGDRVRKLPLYPGIEKKERAP